MKTKYFIICLGTILKNNELTHAKGVYNCILHTAVITDYDERTEFTYNFEKLIIVFSPDQFDDFYLGRLQVIKTLQKAGEALEKGLIKEVEIWTCDCSDCRKEVTHYVSAKYPNFIIKEGWTHKIADYIKYQSFFD